MHKFEFLSNPVFSNDFGTKAANYFYINLYVGALNVVGPIFSLHFTNMQKLLQDVCNPSIVRLYTYFQILFRTLWYKLFVRNIKRPIYTKHDFCVIQHHVTQLGLILTLVAWSCTTWRKTKNRVSCVYANRPNVKDQRLTKIGTINLSILDSGWWFRVYHARVAGERENQQVRVSMILS
jgi:hypothetical protein